LNQDILSIASVKSDFKSKGNRNAFEKSDSTAVIC
jgi:hypothetical protein